MNRDLNIIEKIYSYCLQIEEANEAFNHSFESFNSSSVYRNAICLCLMQIGELSKSLSDEFKKLNSSIPWREIRGMRNMVAHEYGKVDTDTVWETVENGIPQIKEFCKKLIES